MDRATTRRTRSGQAFSQDSGAPWVSNTPTLLPFNLDGAGLLKTAIDREDEAVDVGDDCEGADLTSNPPSPPPSRSASPVLIEPATPTPYSTLSPSGSRASSVLSSAPPTPSQSQSTSPQCQRLPVDQTAPSVEKRRRKDAAALRKKKRRAARASAIDPLGPPRLKPCALKKAEEAARVSVKFNTKVLEGSAAGSYVGVRLEPSRRKTPPSIRQLRRANIKINKWDGIEPQVILDTEGRAMATLVGRPRDDSTWSASMAGASAALVRVRVEGVARGAFRGADLKHRRGNFLAVASGVSFGGGQQKPGNLVHSKTRRRLLDQLLDNPHIRRVAGFQSASLAMFAPKLYDHCRSVLQKLVEHHPGLSWNFSNSIYPAITFNCGPGTACLEHVDHGNAAHMLCAITALGEYDATRGGHLILYPLKEAWEFPPGSTVLTASSTLAHGNTPIQHGETRQSITQYCAGGLLRWVAYGFRSRKSLMAEAGGASRIKEIDGPPGARWRWALNLFSKGTELVSDRLSVFAKVK